MESLILDGLGCFTSQGRRADREQRSEAWTTHLVIGLSRAFSDFRPLPAPLPGLDKYPGREAIGSSSSSTLFKISVKKAANPSTWKIPMVNPKPKLETINYWSERGWDWGHFYILVPGAILWGSQVGTSPSSEERAHVYEG